MNFFWLMYYCLKFQNILKFSHITSHKGQNPILKVLFWLSVPSGMPLLTVLISAMIFFHSIFFVNLLRTLSRLLGKSFKKLFQLKQLQKIRCEKRLSDNCNNWVTYCVTFSAPLWVKYWSICAETLQNFISNPWL